MTAKTIRRTVIDFVKKVYVYEYTLTPAQQEQLAELKNVYEGDIDSDWLAELNIDTNDEDHITEQYSDYTDDGEEYYEEVDDQPVSTGAQR